MAISLTATQESKIKKLADEAGISIPQMFKQVLKHGMDNLDEYFKGIREAEADIKAGRTYSTEQVFSSDKRKKAA